MIKKGPARTTDTKRYLDHLSWLVENRNRAQRTLLSLYTFIEEKSKDKNLIRTRPFRQFAGLMAGAGFSLWRAIFLIHENEGEEKENIQHHEMDFLRTVIRDNTIGYRQDAACNLWTSRYYINNAAFRLVSIGTLLGLVGVEIMVQDKPLTIKVSSTGELYPIAQSLDHLFNLWITYLGWNERHAPPSTEVWDASMTVLEHYWVNGDRLAEGIRGSVKGRSATK
ncbi:MAG: hypothetical protein ACREWG_15685 [Gammaproteobacteria bacterium]